MEIKFRAWLSGKHYNMEITTPYMDYNVWVSPKGNYLDVEGGWNIQGEYETIPLMQYLGLKDKDGKELYQNDAIILNGITYWINDFEDIYIFALNSFNGVFEIIGNNYETPELFENI